jgi:hypothetical protein
VIDQKAKEVVQVIGGVRGAVDILVQFGFQPVNVLDAIQV